MVQEHFFYPRCILGRDKGWLDVVGLDQLPKLIKAAAWISGELEYLQLVVSRMAWQNPWLQIAKCSRFIVFGAFDEDTEFLKEGGRG